MNKTVAKQYADNFMWDGDEESGVTGTDFWATKRSGTKACTAKCILALCESASNQASFFCSEPVWPAVQSARTLLRCDFILLRQQSLRGHSGSPLGCALSTAGARAWSEQSGYASEACCAAICARH